MQFPAVARELWDLLARKTVAGGNLDRLIEALPKKPTGKGKAKQQWLLKHDRTRALDTDFLNFLDEARQVLARDLYRLNDRETLLADNRLNEAVHRILDRLLFLRICEDRDIDTGTRLASIVEIGRRNYGGESGSSRREEALIRPRRGWRLVTSSPTGSMGAVMLFPAFLVHPTFADSDCLSRCGPDGPQRQVGARGLWHRRGWPTFSGAA